MASQVLSGTGNVTYTNNTGQNVRVVINYLETNRNSAGTLNLSWAGVTASATSNVIRAIGRNLAFYSIQNSIGAIAGNNMLGNNDSALPTEIMLAPGQTFSATSGDSTNFPLGAYNIVVIPEAG